MTDEPRVALSVDGAEVVPNLREEEALDHLRGFMRVVRSWGPTHNDAELAAAVHGCQMFVISHMLHRLAPTYWADWFESSQAVEPEPSE